MSLRNHEQRTRLSDEAQLEAARTALSAHEVAVAAGEAIAEMGHRLRNLEQHVAADPDAGKVHPVPRDQLATAIVQNQDVEKFRLAALAGEAPSPVRIQVPMLSNDISGAPGSAGALRVPHAVPGIIGLPRRQLRVADLLPRQRATSTSVIYLRQVSETNNAAPVSELMPKPESPQAYEEIEAPITTLSHWARPSKQILADVPALQNFISNRLMFGLKDVEERQILLGSGVGNNLHGLIPQAVAAEMQNVLGDATGSFRGMTVPYPTRPDIIRVARLQVELDSGLPADAVIMNPVDVAAISAMKNDDGSYFVQRPSVDHGGPGLDEPITDLWQMKVIASTTLTPGQFLVGAFGTGAALYIRDEAAVEVGYAENDFTENAVRILVEERVALPVWVTAAFVVGQF